MDSEDTLAFSALENIRPMIETVALEKAADGFARMIEGKARRPDDLGPAVGFLASDDVRWITGQVIVAAGGKRM